MVEITIDGVRLKVPKNKRILDCALESGIYIPHLCHHPDLPEHGSCRMCVVEVEGQAQVKGQGEVTASCTLYAKEGMEIHTKSSRLQKQRLLALDLLLAGHPSDCSTCPKYGNCELQTLIQYLGGASSRMRHRVKGFLETDKNPLLIHDMNRCVLCGRCVRACNDLRKVGVLQYQKEGMETYVGSLHNKLLKDTDCRFCQACAEVCPTGTIRDKRMMAAQNQTREETVIPCKAACPAHTDVPRYIRLVKEGRFDEAAAVIREKVPFPKALGHVCSHVCEMDCKRTELNEAISIRNIKRYAAAADTGSYWRGKGKQLAATGKKICVVGAGPAGMTAAYYLQKQGHEVTIKEALPSPGGMMGFGIPEYRLPRTIIEEEFQVIQETGVHTAFNSRVDNPISLKKEYDAVLIAIGTHKGVRLPIEGSELEKVLLNTDFLRQASLHQETGIGNKVIVLGGGNVAFDCARTAKRLGAKEIHVACLEARDKMTADEEEIRQAQEEGIQIHPAQTFERILGTTRAEGVEFMNVRSFRFDESHKAVIEKEEGSLHVIAADTVIFAAGQRPDITAEQGLSLGNGNCLIVDPQSRQTSAEGIFAAGDVVYGTKSVIAAIASGREAAREIDKFLGGDGDISEVLAPVEIHDPGIGKVPGFSDMKRAETKIRPAGERVHDFAPVDMGICSKDICKEAGRCLQCDLRMDITPPRLWGSYESEVQ